MIAIEKLRIGMTRAEVIDALGPPTDTGATSRKQRTPLIYLYGNVELHFEGGRAGVLKLVYSEGDNGLPTIHLEKPPATR